MMTLTKMPTLSQIKIKKVLLDFYFRIFNQNILDTYVIFIDAWIHNIK